MKRKKILSIILSTSLVTSSLLLINNSVQASNTPKTTAINSTQLKSNSTFKTGTITASSLNVRSDASLNSKVLTCLNNNTSISIVDTVGDWYKIKLDSTYGYVFKQYVKISTMVDSNSNTVDNNNSVSSKNGIVTSSHLNVRSDASLNSKILTCLNNNTSINILDTVGDWYKIKLDSNYGYVFKQYVKINTQEDSKSNTADNNTTVSFKKGIVTASHLNIRNSAALNSKILATLDKNSSVEIVDTIGNWHKVKLGSSYGYVFKEYVKIQ